MKKSAQEYIRHLEMRLARLEKQANTVNEDFGLLAEVVGRLDSNSPLYMLGQSLPRHYHDDWSKLLSKGVSDSSVKELVKYSKAVKDEQKKLRDTLARELGI